MFKNCKTIYSSRSCWTTNNSFFDDASELQYDPCLVVLAETNNTADEIETVTCLIRADSKIRLEYNCEPMIYFFQDNDTYVSLGDCLLAYDPTLKPEDWTIGYSAFVAFLLLLENYYIQPQIQELFPFFIDPVCRLEDGFIFDTNTCEYYSTVLRIFYQSASGALKTLVYTVLCFVERWSPALYQGKKVSQKGVINCVLNFNRYMNTIYVEQNKLLSERIGEQSKLIDNLRQRVAQLEACGKTAEDI